MSAELQSNITGMWLGEYSYPNNDAPRTAFFAIINDDGGVLKGTTSERSEFTLNDHEDAVIHGLRSGNNVEFHKYYNGDGAYGHVVRYTGEICENSSAIYGNWSIDDYSGNFSMWRELFKSEELLNSSEIDLVEAGN
jgi:hypothetical protein